MIAARAALGALVGLGLGACFQAPGGPVLFSCEPDGKSACPPGYECRPDGCCHDRDTDEGDNEGACKLAPSDGTAATETGTGSDGTASESGSGTEAVTGSDSDSGSDSGSGSGSASETSAEGSSTGDSTGSSDDSASATSTGTAG